MENLCNATVACVTVSPAIIIDADSGSYRIELSPLEVWRLRMFLDLLLSQYPNRDFENEYAERNKRIFDGFKIRSNSPALAERSPTA